MDKGLLMRVPFPPNWKGRLICVAVLCVKWTDSPGQLIHHRGCQGHPSPQPSRDLSHADGEENQDRGVDVAQSLTPLFGLVK